jgi:hypothetical protein
MNLIPENWYGIMGPLITIHREKIALLIKDMKNVD